MCSRPSRSLNNTVTALIRFSSVRYRIRSSRIRSGAMRFLRCSFASRFSSSNSSYDSARKFRSSLDMYLLEWIALHGGPELCEPIDYATHSPQRQSKVLMEEIKRSYGEGPKAWRGRPRPRRGYKCSQPHFESGFTEDVHSSQTGDSEASEYGISEGGRELPPFTTRECPPNHRRCQNTAIEDGLRTSRKRMWTSSSPSVPPHVGHCQKRLGLLCWDTVFGKVASCRTRARAPAPHLSSINFSASRHLGPGLGFGKRNRSITCWRAAVS